MSWYLQKNDGETYGPVEMDELQHWAAEGRIAPQDKLSQDNKHWAAAPDAAELGMDWIASMPDQPTYGPLHLRAFLDLIADGVLAADSRIQHRKSGKIVVLGDALLHALIPEIQGLQVHAEALQAETKRWQQEVEAASAKAGETTKVEISRRKEIEGELKALRKTYDKAKTESEQRLSEAEKRYQSAEKALNDLKASAQKVAAEPGGKDNALSSGKKVGELEKELEQARIALKTETDRAENLEQQVANLTNIGQGSKINLGVAPSPEKRPETGPIDQVKELSVQNALMTKEIAKLKTMYEEERRAGLELENRMNERIGESKRNEADALVHQEDTARRLHHMELNYKKLTDFTEEGGSEEDLKAQFALLITSHNELSQSYDTLLTQLHQKTQEIDRQMAERHQIENEASDRIRVMEAITKREQDEAARMRQQFVRIQATHLQLVKSYREMNDRIICYRQQQDPDAAAQQSEIEGAAPATGPRIRLN